MPQRPSERRADRLGVRAIPADTTALQAAAERDGRTTADHIRAMLAFAERHMPAGYVPPDDGRPWAQLSGRRREPPSDDERRARNTQRMRERRARARGDA